MGAIENIRAEPLFDPDSRYGIVSTPEEQSIGKRNKFDTPYYQRLHGKLMGAWNYERRRQGANRFQMSLDWDYYDGIQLTDEDVSILEKRGQSPLVFNLIKRTVDWVIGTERRTRVDFRIVGREDDDTKIAQIKTKYLKYLSDVNKTHFHRSHAFKESAICGMGWLEDGARQDPTKEPIYSRAETWRNMLHDSLAVETDLSDARWIFRNKWVDTDIALACFPDRRQWLISGQDAANAAMQEQELAGEWYLGNRLAGEDYRAGSIGKYAPWGEPGLTQENRGRVRLIEAWFRDPVNAKVLRGGMFHGKPYDDKHPGQLNEVANGTATVVEKIEMQMFVAIMTESVILDCMPSPYNHNQTPFTPVWCYRRGRDNLPYGLVRNLRDPQDDFNRRMSKALFALSSYRIRATSDAVDPKIMDWDELREEAGRPDALLVHRRGSMLEVDQDRGLGEAHLGLADRDAQHILDASGVTRDNLGLSSNAKSGVAIQAKQQEGAAVTTEVFDNLRMSVQMQGEKQLSLTEQFATEEKVFRITNTRGVTDFVRMNIPEIQPDGSVRFIDDVTATKADFIVDQQDFNTSLRDAASQQLMELAGRMQDPHIALAVMDMAVSASNIPQKDEITGRIRKITGFAGQDESMSDEEKAQAQQLEQQKQAQQQEQQQAQKDAFMAELEVKKATAEKLKAEAIRVKADADKLVAETAMGANPEANAAVQKAQQEAQKAQEDAQKAIDASNKRVADIEGQMALLKTATVDRSVEHATRGDSEIRKAEIGKEAQIAVAKIEAEAAKAVAESGKAVAEAGKATKSADQAVTDLMKLVHTVQMEVEDINKALEEDKKEDKAKASEMKTIVEDAVSKAVKAIPAPVSPVSLDVGKEALKSMTDKVGAGVDGVAKAATAIAAATKALEGAAKAMAESAKQEKKEDKPREPMEITLPDGKKVQVRPLKTKDKPT